MTSTCLANTSRSRRGWLLWLVIGLAISLRLATAFLVQNYVDRKGTLCVFGDTAIYWQLSGQIAHGEPYQVDQMGQPHLALRTPGYPIFLAGCRMLFGDRVLPARLVQAVLNGLAVLLVYWLVELVVTRKEQPLNGPRLGLLAAIAAAIDPYAAGMSVLALSEGPFIPLMLLGLVGLARLWPGDTGASTNRPLAWAVATGLAMGAAIQTRPSWALFVPLLLVAWVGSAKSHRKSAAMLACVVALVVAGVMAPWWVRNARVLGRFVPTALWVGASLYDGLNPQADGSSDMRFLEAPDIARLDERAQDVELRSRSLDFVRSDPARALWLACIKAGRYWSPWPNADTLRSPLAALLSALWTIPLFGLIALGIWTTRHDARAWVLLLGPLLYFLALHMVFVSSIRYRIPGMLPAYGLAAVGLNQIWTTWRRNPNVTR